jgi:hypothetical protein
MFETLAFLSTISLVVIFALLVRMDYVSRQEDKDRTL